MTATGPGSTSPKGKPSSSPSGQKGARPRSSRGRNGTTTPTKKPPSWLVAPLPSDQQYHLQIRLAEGKSLLVELFIADGGDLYKLCIMIFGWIGFRSIVEVQLLDWTGQVLEYYTPMKGWYKPGKEQVPL